MQPVHRPLKLPIQDILQCPLTLIQGIPDGISILAGRPPKKVRLKAEELARRLEQWADSAKPLPSFYAAGVDDDTVEKLEALGYVE